VDSIVTGLIAGSGVRLAHGGGATLVIVRGSLVAP
jgi:hypothetical protein